MDYRNQRGVVIGRDRASVAVDEGLRQYMLKVYNWMTLGLALTGAVAFAVISIEPIQQLFFAAVRTPYGMATKLTILGWIGLFAPLALVFFFSFRLHAMSAATAQLTFWFYAGLMGISLAPIVFVYTGASVAQVFFITAATFGLMSLWGYTTKRDLTGFGNFLMMGLIGILIAMVVNIFLKSSGLGFAISILGVLIFVGLTAYDTQKIKAMYDANDDGEVMTKKGIMGALTLYLDFINIFVFLLQLLGARRD
ncbi:MAG: Bax inhibitor-1/YccA family protein [Rhodospirillaceae bacterium]|nr:Bax inhibitor-1/YccA family protein [Rhodospirillaceae bacterium]